MDRYVHFSGPTFGLQIRVGAVEMLTRGGQVCTLQWSHFWVANKSGNCCSVDQWWTGMYNLVVPPLPTNFIDQK